jgi:alkylation response protein AidB-like acyl-CoA dehydrogenase
MDFNYSNEDEAFRQEFRTWLDQNLQFAVPALGPLADEEEVSWEATLRWHRKLYEGGWLGITWPKEYGGRGGTFLQETICDQELERAGTGVPFTGPGIWLLGPTLIHWGNAAQKERHLRKVLSGEERPFRRQRLEDLDLARASRALDVLARAHRFRRAQT